MRCPKCGCENNQGSNFCESCGQALPKIETAEPITCNQNDETQEIDLADLVKELPNTPRKSKEKTSKKIKEEKEPKEKKRKKKWIAIAVVVVVFAGSIGILTATGITGRMLSNVTAGTFMESDKSKQIEEHYQNGLDFMEKEEYSDAINEFAKVPNNHRRYIDAQKNIEICSQRYADGLIAEIEACNTQEEYEKAFSLLKAANEEAFQDNLDLQEELLSLQESYEKFLIEQIKSLQNNKDYAGALALISSCNKDLLPEENDLDEQKTAIEDAYRQAVLAHAEELLNTDGYEKAIECLRGANEILPNDEAIKNKISEYADYQPVLLYDLDYFNSSTKSFTKKDSIKLNNGETYEDVIEMSYETWEEYKIGSKYNTFSGIVSLSFDNRHTSDDASDYIEIYGDDVLLYESPRIVGGTEPVSFSINISGVDKLKIVKAGNYINYRLYLVEAKLSK